MPMKKRAPGSPHRRVRRSCKHCRRRGHNHVPGTGNSHRFHGLGSFCATHSTTKRGRQYCTRQGIPRSRFGLRKLGSSKTRRKRRQPEWWESSRRKGYGEYPSEKPRYQSYEELKREHMRRRR